MSLIVKRGGGTKLLLELGPPPVQIVLKDEDFVNEEVLHINFNEEWHTTIGCTGAIQVSQRAQKHPGSFILRPTSQALKIINISHVKCRDRKYKAI